MRPATSGRHQRPGAGARRHRGGRRRAAPRRARPHVDGRRSRSGPPRLSGDPRVLVAGRQPAAAQHGEPRRQRPAAHALQLLPRHQLASATSAIRAPAARLSRASTDASPCSASAITASPTTPATSPSRSSRSDAEVETLRGTGERAALSVRDAASLAGRHAAPRDDPRAGRADHRLPRSRRRRGRAARCYLKVRDRAVLRLRPRVGGRRARSGEDGVVGEARIGLGGLAAKPWRAREAEAALRGQRLDEAARRRPREAAFADATAHGDNAFKPELGRRTLVRALLEAAALEQ